MDCGTAFEVGYMMALRKPVLAYTNDVRSWADRTAALYGPVAQWPDGATEANDHMMIEDFGLSENLMIVEAVRACGYEVVVHQAAPAALYSDLTGFRRCLDLLAAAGAQPKR
jgi:nucleoside 2-deoxyribosyltransferase